MSEVFWEQREEKLQQGRKKKKGGGDDASALDKGEVSLIKIVWPQFI